MYLYGTVYHSFAIHSISYITQSLVPVSSALLLLPTLSEGSKKISLHFFQWMKQGLNQILAVCFLPLRGVWVYFAKQGDSGEFSARKETFHSHPKRSFTSRGKNDMGERSFLRNFLGTVPFFRIKCSLMGLFVCKRTGNWKWDGRLGVLVYSDFKIGTFWAARKICSYVCLGDKWEIKFFASWIRNQIQTCLSALCMQQGKETLKKCKCNPFSPPA